MNYLEWNLECERLTEVARDNGVRFGIRSEQYATAIKAMNAHFLTRKQNLLERFVISIIKWQQKKKSY